MVWPLDLWRLRTAGSDAARALGGNTGMSKLSALQPYALPRIRRLAVTHGVQYGRSRPMSGSCATCCATTIRTIVPSTVSIAGRVRTPIYKFPGPALLAMLSHQTSVQLVVSFILAFTFLFEVIAASAIANIS